MSSIMQLKLVRVNFLKYYMDVLKCYALHAALCSTTDKLLLAEHVSVVKHAREHLGAFPFTPPGSDLVEVLMSGRVPLFNEGKVEFSHRYRHILFKS